MMIFFSNVRLQGTNLGESKSGKCHYPALSEHNIEECENAKNEIQ